MTRPGGVHVLLERDKELAALDALLDQALAGRGQVALVEGAAGIGKTSLLDVLCKRAGGAARVLRARGGEQEQQIPLLVTRELFVSYLATASQDELDRVLAGAAAVAGPVVGHGTASTTVTDAGFAAVHGLYWLVANLADERPLVLVVDDAHWADESTQRWLAYLLVRVVELPVLVVLAVRPRELSPASPLAIGLAGCADVGLIQPAALSREAGADVVRSVLPEAVEAFCGAAHSATGGNPLLLARLAAETRERGIAPTAETADQLSRLGDLGLGRLVLPRLHALGPHAVSLARSVALLGDGCALLDAAASAGLGRDEATKALDRLISRDILGDHESPAFTHPLVRAVVAGELSEGERDTLHRRAARALHDRGATAEQVARHLAAVEPLGEPWAVAVLRQAAEDATARGAPEAALASLTALLREPLDQTSRCEVLLEAGLLAYRCRDPRGRDWLESALAVAPTREQAVAAWCLVWNWKLIMQDGHDPATLFDGLPAELDTELSLPILGSCTFDLGFSGASLRDERERFSAPRVDPPGATYYQRLWLAAEAQDEAVTCGDRHRALRCAASAYAEGRLLEEAGDFAHPAWVVLVQLVAGEIRLAEATAREAEDHARRTGSQLPLEWSRGAIAWCQLAGGHLRDADATLGDWLEQDHEAPAPIVRPSHVAILATAHLGRGRAREAEETLARFGLLDTDPPSNFHGSVLLNARALLHLVSGRVDAALRDYLTCGSVLDSFGCRSSTFTPWRSGAATCLALLGRSEEALAHAEEQVDDARRWGAAPLLGSSVATMGAVVGGDDGIDLVREAVVVLEGSEAQGEHARALLELGRLLRLNRHRADARRPLQEALDLADRLGSALLASTVEQELALTGARPRRRALTGADALTPAELRVATLAAQGMTNPEIAQSLFVTRKTVEKQLSAAFLKLQISSRDQLPTGLRGKSAESSTWQAERGLG